MRACVFSIGRQFVVQAACQIMKSLFIHKMMTIDVLHLSLRMIHIVQSNQTCTIYGNLVYVKIYGEKKLLNKNKTIDESYQRM